MEKEYRYHKTDLLYSYCTNTDIKAKSIDAQELTQFSPAGHNDVTFSNEDGTNNVPICSYHYGTGMHTQHIVTAKHVENISVTTARDSSTPTVPKYYNYNTKGV